MYVTGPSRVKPKAWLVFAFPRLVFAFREIVNQELETTHLSLPRRIVPA